MYLIENHGGDASVARGGWARVWRLACVLLFTVASLASGVWVSSVAGVSSMPDPDMHMPSTYALATGQSLARTGMVADGRGNVVRRQWLHAEASYLLIHADGDVRVWDRDADRGQALVPTDNQLVSSALRVLRDGGLRDQAGAQEAGSRRVSGSFTGLFRSTQYFPSAYLPQAAGLALGRAAGLDAWGAWRCARLANLLAFVALYAAALWLVPVGRPVLLAVGLHPTLLYMAASLMPDAVLTAVVALFTALTLRAAYRGRPVGGMMLCLLVLLAVWVCWGKASYAPVLLPVLCLPGRVLPVRRKVACLSAVVGCMVPWLWWSRVFSGGQYAIDYRANLGYAAAHPLDVLVRAGWNTLLVGRELWPLDSWYAVLVLVLVVAAAGGAVLACLRGPAPGCLRAAHRAPVPPSGRLGYVAVALLGAVTCMYGVYVFEALTWNDLSAAGPATLLDGFQGRYLLPVAPLLAVASVQAAASRRPAPTGPAPSRTAALPGRTRGGSRTDRSGTLHVSQPGFDRVWPMQVTG